MKTLSRPATLLLAAQIFSAGAAVAAPDPAYPVQHLYLAEGASARTIAVPFQVLPRTGSDGGAPIFVLDGGPGQSTVDGFVHKELVAALRSVADVVLVDQRGSLIAQPQLTCDEQWQLPVNRAVTRDELIDAARRNFASCAAAWRAKGADLSAYNTRAYGQDLFRVADLIGARKIRIVSFSFGTQIAQAAMQVAPERIEKVALFGPMPTARALRRSSDYDGIVARADRIARQDNLLPADAKPLADILRGALARIATTPIPVPPPAGAAWPADLVIDENAARSAFLDTLGTRKRLREGLPLLLAIDRGDALDKFAPLLQAIARDMVPKNPAKEPGLRRGLMARRAAAQHMLTTCASGIGQADYAQMLREERTTIFGHIAHVYLPEACDGWNVPDLGDAYRAPPKPGIPTLFVVGGLDTKTPLDSAVEAARAMGSSARLVTIENAGHGELLDTAPEIQPLLLRFFKDGTVTVRSLRLSQSAPSKPSASPPNESGNNK